MKRPLTPEQRKHLELRRDQASVTTHLAIRDLDLNGARAARRQHDFLQRKLDRDDVLRQELEQESSNQ